jgi:hypothetical protein
VKENDKKLKKKEERRRRTEEEEEEGQRERSPVLLHARLLYPEKRTL